MVELGDTETLRELANIATMGEDSFITPQGPTFAHQSVCFTVHSTSNRPEYTLRKRPNVIASGYHVKHNANRNPYPTVRAINCGCRRHW